MSDEMIIARSGGQPTTPALRDLTAWPGLALLRRPWFMRSLQGLSVGLLVLAIGLGLWLPDRRDGLTVLLFWGIFWPLLTAVVTPTLGPVFCSLCPHGVMGRWIQKFGLKRRFPRALRGAWIGLVLILLGYWALAFTMPGLLSASTQATAWYFLGFTLLALASFLFFADMAYCKHICPLGRVLAVHGKVGGLRIGTEQSACSQCTTFDCASACQYHLSPFRFEARNNTESCTLCLDCLPACNKVQLQWQRPGKRLGQPMQGASRQDFWVLLLIFAVAGVGIQFLHGLQHTGWREHLPWNLLGSWTNSALGVEVSSFRFMGLYVLLFAVGLTVPLALYGYRLAARVIGADAHALGTDLAYGLAPVAILSLVPHAVTRFATANGPALLNETGALLGLGWQFSAFAGRGDLWLQVLGYLPWLGIIWTFWLIWRRAGHWVSTVPQRTLVWALACLPMWFYLGIWVLKLLAPAAGGGHAH